MGQILHGRAKTTHAVRAFIQRSKASNAALSQKLGINVKTVAKWRKRDTVEDAPMGPKQVRSTVLTIEEEAAIVAFRRYTLLPLDDCLFALKPSIPKLTRSCLHRCLQRHGISRLPRDQDKKTRSTFKHYPIGYFHIDIAELSTGQGKSYLFVAIDRTSKFAYLQLHQRAGKLNAAEFLGKLITAVPYKIHTILSDNGIQFTNRKRDRFAFEHIFTRLCKEQGIDHRLTQVNHPWTNGQVERMNRTIKEATVKRYHYDNHDQLEAHLKDFVRAYNYARRLKALKGLTPFEYICRIWIDDPDRFIINPDHFIPEPYI